MAVAEIPYSVRQRGCEALFLKAVANGTSEKMAEMLALQEPPGIRGTNDQFMRGMKHGGQFNPDKPFDRMVIEDAKRQAKRAGISLSGKYYSSQCADYPNDPRAWFANKDDEAAYIRSRGWSCRGGKVVKGREVEVEHKPYCVSDEIVEEEVEKVLQEHPDLSRRELEDLRESLKVKLSGAMYGR